MFRDAVRFWRTPSFPGSCFLDSSRPRTVVAPEGQLSALCSWPPKPSLRNLVQLHSISCRTVKTRGVTRTTPQLQSPDFSDLLDFSFHMSGPDNSWLEHLPRPQMPPAPDFLFMLRHRQSRCSESLHHPHACWFLVLVPLLPCLIRHKLPLTLTPQCFRNLFLLLHPFLWRSSPDPLTGPWQSSAKTTYLESPSSISFSRAPFLYFCQSPIQNLSFLPFTSKTQFKLLNLACCAFCNPTSTYFSEPIFCLPYFKLYLTLVKYMTSLTPVPRSESSKKRECYKFILNKRPNAGLVGYRLGVRVMLRFAFSEYG